MTPEVKVEVAFGFGPYDPEPLAIDWDEITSDVFEISITRRREPEFARFPASTATVLLRNEDRTYDPLNTSSPYYGQLLPNVPIRITATVDSTDYPVWRGYVDGWPTVWSEGGFAAEVQVAATDAFKLLAERFMPDHLEKFIDSFAPGFPDYWARMDRAVDNVLINDGTMGYNGVALAALDVVDPLVQTSSGTWTISAVIQVNGRGFRGIFETEHAAGTMPVVFAVNSYSAGSNTISFLIDGGSANISGNSGIDVGNGGIYHVVLVRSTINAYLYVHGQLDTFIANVSATGYEAAAGGRHLIGRSPLGATATGPEIVIDEVTAWRGTALTVTQVADLYEALTVGFSVEQDTGLAIDAVLDEIGWLPGLRGSIDGEVVVKLPANPARTGVLELLHRIADSEGGRFYIDKEGKVVQESRS